MDVSELTRKLIRVRAWELKHVRISELHKMAVDLAMMSQVQADTIKAEVGCPEEWSLWGWVEFGASARSGASASTQSA